MSKTNVSSSDSRVLQVLKTLRGHALGGTSNGGLVVTLHESPTNVDRAFNAFIEEGLALKSENGCFAPGI